MNVILHKNSTSFKILLIIAGFYHLLWGIFVITFPGFFFRIANLPSPNYMELWQATGLYTALLGIGYLLASSNPIRFWRIVLLGFLNKVVIIISFLISFLYHAQNSILFDMIIVNHIIWLFPFALILYNAYLQQYEIDKELIRMNHSSTDELLSAFVTNKHHTITELVQQQPVMLVFLRHFGCVFCRETLLNIKKIRPEIEQQGTRIVLVNMANEKKCMRELSKYGLDDVEYIGDSESLLYKAFKLRRGTLSELYGFKVLFKGMYLLLKDGISLPPVENADVTQMPGIFLIYNGAVVKQFIHRSVADNPPYLELSSLKSGITT